MWLSLTCYVASTEGKLNERINVESTEQCLGYSMC